MSARAALATLAIALGCGTPAAEPARHVLLISIDTLRADHLGLYGYERPTSPNLDALAAESVVFDNAWSTAPWTLPAHASLLTGLYPSHHGARGKRERLASEAATLAETLRDAGFATGAVVNATFLAPSYRLNRGFDAYRWVREATTPEGVAEKVSDAGLRWLAAQGERRTFLFLHYFDVHSDYGAAPRFARSFTVKGGRLRGTTEELTQIRRGMLSPSAQDIQQLTSLYDAGIAQLDHRLGRLFERLRASDRWRDTLVVVTSDHGEEFHDHGGVSHGATHYEEILRVPLLIRHPGDAQGRRIETPVSLVDVAPTVLALAGLAPPEGLDGIDVSRLFSDGEPSRGSPVIAQTGPELLDRLRSARDEDFKLILDRDRNQRRLFDLGDDPEEQHDVSEAHPEIARRLEAAISALDANALPPTDAIELSPEDLARLRALGYGMREPSAGEPAPR